MPRMEAFQEYFDWELYRRRIEKLERQGGIVLGEHGTSASKGCIIRSEGFKDFVDREIRPRGEIVSGVWFWDSDEVPRAAHTNGVARAKEFHEDEYAIVYARLTNPIPDFKNRPQWFVTADRIEIIKIDFHRLP